MQSESSLAKEERARTLKRLFQIIALAQEDWAMAHDQGKSTGAMKKPDSGDCILDGAHPGRSHEKGT